MYHDQTHVYTDTDAITTMEFEFSGAGTYQFSSRMQGPLPDHNHEMT